MDALPTQIPAFNLYLGTELRRMERGEALVTLELAPHHLNSRGVVHGGVLASLLDSALGAAVISAIPKEWWCATISLSVQFLEGARRGVLERGRGRERESQRVQGRDPTRGRSAPHFARNKHPAALDVITHRGFDGFRRGKTVVLQPFQDGARFLTPDGRGVKDSRALDRENVHVLDRGIAGPQGIHVADPQKLEASGNPERQHQRQEQHQRETGRRPDEESRSEGECQRQRSEQDALPHHPNAGGQ
jgi:uncharacterized protein (TIGR00369 family)